MNYTDRYSSSSRWKSSVCKQKLDWWK